MRCLCEQILGLILQKIWFLIRANSRALTCAITDLVNLGTWVSGSAYVYTFNFVCTHSILCKCACIYTHICMRVDVYIHIISAQIYTNKNTQKSAPIITSRLCACECVSKNACLRHFQVCTWDCACHTWTISSLVCSSLRPSPACISTTTWKHHRSTIDKTLDGICTKLFNCWLCLQTDHDLREAPSQREDDRMIRRTHSFWQ